MLLREAYNAAQLVQLLYNIQFEISVANSCFIL
jgi:hypothetical protein